MSARKTNNNNTEPETKEIENIMDNTLQTILKELELVREDSKRTKEEARRAVEEAEERARAERLEADKAAMEEMAQMRDQMFRVFEETNELFSERRSKDIMSAFGKKPKATYNKRETMSS